MYIDMIPVKGRNGNGMLLRALIIEKGDKSTPCENCGKPKYNHPELIREMDDDWCLNCNDDAMIKEYGMSDRDYAEWCLKQTMNGYAVIVAKRQE